MKLTGKTALVTGGAVRIGRALCRALASAGMNVVIHCNQSLEEARTLQVEIEQAGGRAWVVNAYLQEQEACARLINVAKESAGHLDVLINNAALFLPDTLSTLQPDTAERQWRTNLQVPMYLMQAFTRQIRGKAHIINMLDRRICQLDPDYLSYTMSKKALADLTLSAAQELAPDICVNAIAPGAILPPVKKAGCDVAVPAGSAPLTTSCSLQDVSDAVLFLLKSDVITGQIVYVDAGQHLTGQGCHG